MIDVPREVLADGARRTVRVRRHFDFAPGEVWSALVEPERVARWCADLDLADDGGYVLTFSGQDGSQVRGDVLECDEPSRLLVSMRWDAGPEGILQVTLAPAEEGTDLVLEHRSLPAIAAPGYGSGWEAHLELLAAEVLRGAGWVGTAPPAVPTGFDKLVPAYRTLEAAAVAGVVVPGELGRGRTGNGAGARLARVLDAPVGEVWAALTRPEQLGRWMWPVLDWPGGLDADPPRELAIGDSIVFGDANMPDGRLRFDVVELEAPLELVVLWGPDSAGDDNATQVQFSLADFDGATLLTIQQDPAPEVVAAGRLRGGADFAAGWHALVDALAVLLTGQPGPEADELWEAAFRVYGAPGDGAEAVS